MTALLPLVDGDAADQVVQVDTRNCNNNNNENDDDDNGPTVVSFPDWVNTEEWGEALDVPEWRQQQESTNDDNTSNNNHAYRLKHGWKGRDLMHDVDSPVRIFSYHVQYGSGIKESIERENDSTATTTTATDMDSTTTPSDDSPMSSSSSSSSLATQQQRGGVGTTLRGIVHFTTRAESHAGYCHGGSMTSVMDDVIGWTAFTVTGTCLPWTGFTVQVNCSLQKPIPVGSYLMVQGTITKVERRKVFVEASLVDPSQHQRNPVVHATGSGLVVMNRGLLPES
ncbi:thioesterase-like superfamily protein [Nitzschia inconspicua]|uniref:Thioesterase-like superfamily protein n=1 Tax=Nitzschia inconspicua TaxID=303405 RepID=A0A9K3KNY2_9STRA|nr:thioesterase-like superfamily protein [Nitzschia inconspicua]